MTEREAFEAWAREEGYHSLFNYPLGLSLWQAACAWQKEKDAKLCEAYAIDRRALYKGRPPYTGQEPGRYDPYTEGASDAADLCAEKIRSAG